MAKLAGLSGTVLTALAAWLGLAAAEAAAFDRVQAPAPPKPEMMENCPGLVAANRPRVMPAALRLARNPDEVRITYVGHSTCPTSSP